MVPSSTSNTRDDDDGDAVVQSATIAAVESDVEWMGLTPEEEQRERQDAAEEESYFHFTGVTERSLQLAEAYECRARRQRRVCRTTQTPKAAPRRSRYNRVFTIRRDEKLAFVVEQSESDDQATHVMHANNAAAAGAWSQAEWTPTPSARSNSSWDRSAAHQQRGGTASRADVARVTDSQYLMQTGLTIELLAQMMARDLTPEDYEVLLQLDNAVAKKTVDASALDNALVTPTARPSADDVCMICLDGFDGLALDKIVALSACKHVFHVPCIKSWLGEQSTKCPTCQTQVK